MVNKNQTTKIISLESYGIYNANVNYQLTATQLQNDTILKGQGKLANSGALAVNTGEFGPADQYKDLYLPNVLIELVSNKSKTDRLK